MMLEKVVWMCRVSASSSDDSSRMSGSSWMRATRYGSLGDEVVDAHALRRPARGSAACRRASSACARSCRRRRRGRRRRAPAARSRGPCWRPSRACGRGTSASFTSCTERSWPTASGVIVFGKATVSFSGRTGSASGSVVGSTSTASSSRPRGSGRLRSRRLGLAVLVTRPRSAPARALAADRRAAARRAGCRPRRWRAPRRPRRRRRAGSRAGTGPCSISICW